jgi:ribosome-interacting GTPase 1
MPTNLPPEYFDAEKRYRAAESASEKISCLEELLGTIPKHKGTDKLRAEYRRKLSKLKVESQKRKSVGHQESVYHIEREGAGRVVVSGAANVGKSSLVAALTHASPKVSEYPYTTWTPTPGMMLMEDVQIQLIDTPPLNREHVESELFDLIRRADLVLLVVDLQGYPVQQLEETATILNKHNIVPQHFQGSYADQENKVFVPVLVVVNKYDNQEMEEDFEIFRELLDKEWPLLPVSATTSRNLEKFTRTVFDKLEIIRIYSKPPGKDPDLGQPFVMKKGSTVEELAEKVHKDFIKNLKTARIWGSDVYNGQMVGKDHVLADGDIVELHL